MRQCFWLRCAALPIGLFLVSANARAWHTEDQHLLDNTAYTLPRGKAQLGLGAFRWGALGPLTLGTTTWPWIALFPNGHVKWNVFSYKPISFGLQAGVIRANVRNITNIIGGMNDLERALLWIVPLESHLSWRFGPKPTLSVGATYTYINVVGQYKADAFQGVAGTDNLQLTGSFEWRFNRVTALVVQGRYQVFQRATAQANSTTNPDGYTTLDVAAAGGSGDIELKTYFSIVPSVAFSWEKFNLRLGVGYGNMNVSPINMMIPIRTPIPEFDLFWIL
ncbi:MAG: hypothetical protein WCI05_13800 [Myxococcales bacterium]